MIDKKFKEVSLYSYTTSCFTSFKKEYNIVSRALELSGSERFEKIVYRINDNGIEIIGVYSDSEAIKNQKLNEVNEYRRLKDEFEPDPEDTRDTIRMKTVNTKKWFNKLLGK